MIKHQITVHTLGHGSRPLPITAQAAQHSHRQSESPKRNSQQARTAAEGGKNPNNHIAISKRLATGNVIRPVRRARRLQRGQTRTCDINYVNRLAQAACLAKQGKETKPTDEALNLGNIFVPSQTIKG